jgi:hypothetical protein
LIVTAVLAVKYGGAAGLVAVVPAVAFIVTSIYSWFR